MAHRPALSSPPNASVSVDQPLHGERFGRRSVCEIIAYDRSQRQRRQRLFAAPEIAHAPPAKTVKDSRLGVIGHKRLKSLDPNDPILLLLRYPALAPIERVMPAPNHRPHLKSLKAQFLEEFASQTLLDVLRRLQPAAGCDPEVTLALRRADAHEQNMLVRRQENRADRISLFDHRCCRVMRGSRMEAARSILLRR